MSLKTSKREDVHAGLAIPVKNLNDIRQFVDCLILSKKCADALREQLTRAMGETPVDMRDVEQLQRKIASRRDTHRALLERLNESFTGLNDFLQWGG